MYRFALLVVLALAACDRHTALREQPLTTPHKAPSHGHAAAAEPSAWDAEVEPPQVEGRPLTDGEIAMVKPIYGASVDFTLVRVVPAKFTALQADDTYMTPDGNIYAPGDLFREDFSADDVGPYLRAIFVHEMAHVWQHQSGLDIIAAGLITFVGTKAAYETAYTYSLDGRDLTEYGVEQQASILEDWFLITALGVQPASYLDPPTDADDRDAKYKLTLHAFIADPTYARALGPDELLRRHAAASGADVP